jgi:hypothetical protein
MNTQPVVTATMRNQGPHLGMIAIIFTVLFNAGLFPVTMFGGMPYFPGPWESADVIAAFFQARPSSVIICAFFHFGSAVSLGIFTASAVSQLRFLGVRAAGVSIAFFGGIMTAANITASAFMLWAMAHPGIANNTSLINALYFMQYAFGGPGFSVFLGLLIAGISIPSGLMKLLPRWLVIFGIVLAVMGELSWFNIITPKALFLIPLTRFPGFVWLIIVGFKLPRTKDIKK